MAGEPRLDVILSVKDEATDRVQSFGAAAGAAFGAVARTALKLSIAATAATAAVVTLAKSAANAGNELSDLSQRVGIAADKLSELKFSAELGGSSIDAMAMSLQIFAKNVRDVTRGLETKAGAFRELGITVTDANGTLKSVDDLLLEVADAFKALEDGTLKTALAYELFSSRGVELIPVLNKGSEGLREQRAMAQRLGITWSTDAARAADEFNDRLQEMFAAFKGLAITIGKELIPILLPVLEAVREIVIKFREWVETSFLLQATLGLIAKGLLLFGIPTVRGLEDRISELRREMERIEKGGTLFLEGVGTGLEELGELGSREGALAALRQEIAAAETALRLLRGVGVADEPKRIRPSKDIEEGAKRALEAREALARADQDRIAALIQDEEELTARLQRIEADRLAGLISAEEAEEQKRKDRARDRREFEARRAAETTADILAQERARLQGLQAEYRATAELIVLVGNDLGQQFGAAMKVGLIDVERNMGTFGENVTGLMRGVGAAWTRSLDDVFFAAITGKTKDFARQLGEAVLRELTGVFARQATASLAAQAQRLFPFVAR